MTRRWLPLCLPRSAVPREARAESVSRLGSGRGHLWHLTPALPGRQARGHSVDHPPWISMSTGRIIGAHWGIPACCPCEFVRLVFAAHCRNESAMLQACRFSGATSSHDVRGTYVLPGFFVPLQLGCGAICRASWCQSCRACFQPSAGH